jgi:DNA-binding CsgD family transcriptional regulator
VTEPEPSTAEEAVPARTPAAETEGELSDREAEVPRLLAVGRLNQEIAAGLGLDVAAVGSLEATAMEKLGLKTRADLVRYVVQQMWLTCG